jgi:chromosome segregation ATPase
MPPLGLGKKRGTEAMDEIRELRAGDILGKLADVAEQLSKARQDYQTLQSIFLKLDEKNTAVDQKTSEMRAEMSEMKTRVAEMHALLGEMNSKLGDLPQMKTKIHATQGDVQELHNAVDRMSQILDDLDKLFKYLKSPGF